MRFNILIVYILLTSAYNAQVDSVLTFDEYISIVFDNHPIAKNARLAVPEANAYLLKAKGAFEPKFGYQNLQKQFDGKNYYTINSTAFKIPTWFGIDLKGGYDYNTGIYLSEEHILPSGGLWYGGLTLPVGQNLVIDERRTTLRKAQVLQNQALIEQKIGINDLLLEAASIYWDWYRASLTVKVSENAVKLAKDRFSNSKISAELGDNPYIDTLEAHILLQTRENELSQARIQEKNFRNQLNTYLWMKDATPLELTDFVHPQEDFKYTLLDNKELDTTNSIWLKYYAYKIQLSELDKRLKQEYLKPQLDLSYHPLLRTNGSAFPVYNPNDYKFGISASYGVLLRKERADLQLAKIKITELTNDLSFKQQEVLTKVNSTRFEFEQLTKQIEIQENLVQSYEVLTNAEITKFQMGESSLFLVNTREMKLIEARMKLYELQTKYFQTYAKYKWITAQ